MKEQPTSAESQFAAKPGWRFGFWSLIVTQFQNAFNDNAIKFLVIYLVVAMNFPKERRDLLVLIVGALFALPFIFFSLTGGYFADRYSKRHVVIGTKLMEIFVMGVTILGFGIGVEEASLLPWCDQLRVAKNLELDDDTATTLFGL